MRGLVRHNLFSMMDNLKMALIINLLLTVFMGVCVIFRNLSGSGLAAVVLIQLVIYVLHIAVPMQADSSCRWSRFEITMPVKRKDIVKARYICYLLNGILGIVTGFISIVIFNLLQGNVNAERLGFSITFGIVLLIFVPALMHPLLLLVGADKSETILTISILAVTAMFLGGSVLFNRIFPYLEASDVIFRAFIIILSIICFGISYIISVQVYKNKEV